MISKDELIKSVAQSCGVSVEIASFFFEVYVNRLSNKLKQGDLLHFQNYGFFHKRNCRIQIEKTSDSPTPKSYLIQLVLFSSEMKINNDLSDVHFLKIPNLKSLWVDDKDFQKSLNAGDFAPHTERNQLIKSFATKAEVIISSLRKDYDSELVEELIIPLTFDLNFLVKSGQKGSTSSNSASKVKTDRESSSIDKTNQPTASTETTKADKLKTNQKPKETTEEGLPWNYGTKFLEKDKTGNVEETIKTDGKSGDKERAVITKTEIDFRKDQAARLKEFEPVTSHVPTKRDGSTANVEKETVKFSVSKGTGVESENSGYTNKFTEVKSRTEPYRQRGDSGKTKYDRFSSRKYSDEKAFTQRRNFLPIVAVASFIIIASIVVYIYFIKDDNAVDRTDLVLFDIKPPTSVNVIDRNFDFIVSYPYPKMENRIEMSGFNDDLFASAEIKTEMNEETKTKIKTETKTEKTTGLNNPPKTETPVVEKTKPVIEEKKVSSNRIFLYRNFYVVYIGSFKSEDDANREADRYFDLGYNAIVEEIESASGKREYKLSVGDFTSEEFAKQFQEKYIKY